MQENDVAWAQSVIDRWAIKKAVPAPRVKTTAESETIELSGYQDSAIFVNGKAWDKLELAGKLLLPADPFSYHVRCVSDAVNTDEEMSDLARGLIVLEVELWSDATGVAMTKLMRTKSVSKLVGLLDAGSAAP